MKIILILLISPIWMARADDPPASNRLEEALTKDVGPVCRIGKLDFYLEPDQEGLCKTRGGVVQIAARQGLRRNMSSIESDEYKHTLKPTGAPEKRQDGSINPYHHPDPSSPAGQ